MLWTTSSQATIGKDVVNVKRNERGGPQKSGEQDLDEMQEEEKIELPLSIRACYMLLAKR